MNILTDVYTKDNRINIYTTDDGVYIECQNDLLRVRFDELDEVIAALNNAKTNLEQITKRAAFIESLQEALDSLKEEPTKEKASNLGRVAHGFVNWHSKTL